MLLFATFDAAGAAAVIGALTGLVIAVTGLIVVVAKLWIRDNATDHRVDGLIRGNIRRGKAEGIHRRYIVRTAPEEDSALPFQINPRVRQAFNPIAPALRLAYQRSKAKDETEVQFTERIADTFGGWLAEYLCPHLGLQDNSCIEMAKIVAQEPESPPGSSDDPERQKKPDPEPILPPGAPDKTALPEKENKR